MVTRLREYAWIAVGSIVIASGSTLAGLAAFDGSVGTVMLGFLLFIVGYGLSQAGTHAAGDGLFQVPSRFTGVRVGWETGIRAGLLLAGWAGIALGVTLFSRTILHPGLSKAVFAGVTSITGYMAAHVGINGVGLGDSVFTPVLTRLQRTPRYGGDER